MRPVLFSNIPRMNLGGIPCAYLAGPFVSSHSHAQYARHMRRFLCGSPVLLGYSDTASVLSNGKSVTISCKFIAVILWWASRLGQFSSLLTSFPFPADTDTCSVFFLSSTLNEGNFPIAPSQKQTADPTDMGRERRAKEEGGWLMHVQALQTHHKIWWTWAEFPESV